MNTQAQTTSKGQLLLVLAGLFAIPLYAVYVNETPNEKLSKLKKHKSTAVTQKTVKPVFKETTITPQQNLVITDDMSFDEAFNYYRKTQGEGSVFSWQDYEYRVNVFEPVIPPSKYDTLSFGKAFKLARNELGKSNKFEWQGAVYSTSIVGETKKSKTQVVKTDVEKKKPEAPQMSFSENVSEVQKHYLYGMNNADHYHRNISGLSACFVPSELCRFDRK